MHVLVTTTDTTAVTTGSTHCHLQQLNSTANNHATARGNLTADTQMLSAKKTSNLAAFSLM